MALVGVLVIVACDGGSSTPPAPSDSTTPATSSTGPAAPTARVEGSQLPADVYTYLEDPERTSENQLDAHVLLRPFADAEAARRGDPTSPWERALDGTWRLMLSQRPEDVPREFWRTDFDAAQLARGRRCRTPGSPTSSTTRSSATSPTEIVPDDPPRVPRDVNPTGAYVRNFDLPADWTGPAHRSCASRASPAATSSGSTADTSATTRAATRPAEFDITERCAPGRNRIAVQVHRWGAGSYLEDFDQWRYSGIFRVGLALLDADRPACTTRTITTDLDADVPRRHPHRRGRPRRQRDRRGAIGRIGSRHPASTRTASWCRTMTGRRAGERRCRDS